MFGMLGRAFCRPHCPGKVTTCQHPPLGRHRISERQYSTAAAEAVVQGNLTNICRVRMDGMQRGRGSHLSNKKQPQIVILRASISVSSRLLEPESILSPKSYAIRKLIPLYTHPRASRPHPASRTDMSAKA